MCILTDVHATMVMQHLCVGGQQVVPFVVLATPETGAPLGLNSNLTQRALHEGRLSIIL